MRNKINTIKIKGFSIIEAMLAVLVFALCATPILWMQLNAQKNTESGYFQSEVASMLTSGLDLLMAENNELFSADFTREHTIISGQNPNSSFDAINQLSQYLNNIVPQPDSAIICINVSDVEANGHLLGKNLQTKVYWYTRTRITQGSDTEDPFLSCSNADTVFSNNLNTDRIHINYLVFKK